MNLTLPKRLASIDVFRALTMLLMIFVNDLWSLKNIPGWLEHVSKEADGMGLADTVFPAFLFIVGLSIPLAISNRQQRGGTDRDLLIYIGTRTLALLVMGFFHVNLENYNRSEALLPKPIWQIAITVGFFLIWLDYSPSMAKGKKRIFQGAGVLMLVVMAALFKGGDPGHASWMRPSWWGILGLIGWSYLWGSVICLFSRERVWVLLAALGFFLMFNIGVDMGWLDDILVVKKYIWVVGDGSMPALTICGVLVTVLYRRLLAQGKTGLYWLLLTGLALAMLCTGFILRPCWGINKIRATPSWVMICTAISIACFMGLTWLVDLKGKKNWFSWIAPGGTSTLTAYLLPYIHYALLNLLGKAVLLPPALRNGMTGIAKSLIYAMLIIFITGLMERKRIRLRI